MGEVQKVVERCDWEAALAFAASTGNATLHHAIFVDQEKHPLPQAFAAYRRPFQDRTEQLEAQLADANQLIRAIEGENIIVRAQLADARALVPADARKLAEGMLVGYGYPASHYAADAGLTEKRTRELLAAFRTLGWAEWGPFHCEDDNLIRGSGTWLTPAGDGIRALTPGCEHQTGPSGDAGQ